MSGTLRRSIARLLARGEPCGTAWVIAPGIVATAKHCLEHARDHLGGSEHELTVEFLDRQPYAATWTERDLHPTLDFVLLSLEVTDHPAPLPLIRRPQSDGVPFTIQWWTYGYPDLFAELNAGLPVGGQIGWFHSVDEGQPAVHLRTQFLNTVAADSALGGLSGAPIFTGDPDGRVFATVKRAPPDAADQIQIAVPLDAVAAHYGAVLAQANWHDWPDPPADFLNIVPCSGHSCRVEGLEPQQLCRIWHPGGHLAWLGCGFESHAYPALSSALLRVALHAPGTVELRVPRVDDWQRLAEKLGKNWLPARGYNARQRSREMQWRATPISAPMPPTLGVTPQEVGESIHQACDAWVLDELSRRVAQVFGDDAAHEDLRFRLHASFHEAMPARWDGWRQQFAANRVLLRHFLAMMLTANADYDTTTAVIGAGPRTLEQCLLQPLIFTLAVNICLPDTFGLTSNRPGNLTSMIAGSGHACGIEIHDQQDLHVSLSDYSWSTSFVFLRHLACEPRLREAVQTRANRELGVPALELSAPLSRPVLFSGDEQMLGKLREGTVALRAHLLALHEEKNRRQQQYIARLAAMP